MKGAYVNIFRGFNGQGRGKPLKNTEILNKIIPSWVFDYLIDCFSTFLLYFSFCHVSVFVFHVCVIKSNNVIQLHESTTKK